MARRRRYDTEALVGQMRSERRTALILSLAGVFILGFLLTLYVTGIGSDDEVPEVPTSAGADTADADSALDAGSDLEEAPEGPGEEELEPEEPEPEPEPAPPAKVSISLSKKGTLWVDGKKYNKVKGKSIELTPGPHSLKAKVGKKTVQAQLKIAGGESLVVAFHHKKKTAAISKAGSGGGKKKKKKKKKRKR